LKLDPYRYINILWYCTLFSYFWIYNLIVSVFRITCRIDLKEILFVIYYIVRKNFSIMVYYEIQCDHFRGTPIKMIIMNTRVYWSRKKCEWIEHNISYALARCSKRWGRQDILVIWWRGKRKHYSTLGEQASSSELWGPSTSRFTNWTRSWLKYNWHSFLITKHRRRPSVRTVRV